MKACHTVLGVGAVVGASVPGAQPNAHDSDWVHAPREVLEEMKAGHLAHHFHPHHRHASSLLSEHVGTEEGTMTGKILGDIGSAEHALETALRGAPGILKKEEGLLKKASFMATEAGHFQAAEKKLTQRMKQEGASIAHKSAKHMTVQQATAMIRDVAKRETALVADGFGILRETKNLKVDVVEAIGESDPATAAKVEHLLDSVGIDQKQIMHGEAKLAHGIKQSLLAQRSRSRQHSQSMAGLARAAHDEEQLAHKGAGVMKSAETIKEEVSHLLAGSKASQIQNLMDQVEHIQHNVDSENHKASVDDLRLLREHYQSQMHQMPHQSHNSRHPALAQKSTAASDAAMLAKFAREEHSLNRLATRRQGMVKESRHVLAETGRAQAAIEEELGGTSTGNAIAELLEKAQAAERQAATGSQKEAALAMDDVHAVQKLEHVFKRSNHVHV